MRGPYGVGTVLALLVLGAMGESVADRWDWPLGVNPKSDGRLRSLHEALALDACSPATQVPVSDAHWRDEGFHLYLKSGTLYLCPAIEGVPVLASFHGEAVVSYQPSSRGARRQLEHWIGRAEVGPERVTEAHFFTLRGQDLAGQLGLTVPAEPSRGAPPESDPGRRVFRRLGTRLAFAFLNRDTQAAGTAWIAFPLESLRPVGNGDAMAVFSIDPQAQQEVALAIAGHATRMPPADYRTSVLPIAEEHAAGRRFRPTARGLGYRTEVRVRPRYEGTTVRATVRFRPEAAAGALRLRFATRMQVSAVTDERGAPLPFLQWAFKEMDPALDESLLVRFDPPLQPGQETRIEIASRGPLIESVGTYYKDVLGFVTSPYEIVTGGTTRALLDEDAWYPALDDPAGAIHEVVLCAKGKLRGYGSGLLVRSWSEGDDRCSEFRTERPVPRTTFYVGQFRDHLVEADGIALEVYTDTADVDSMRNIEYAANELGNALRVYRQLFTPLDITRFRAVSTPTFHGRGFAGILLLSGYGGFRGDTSGADTFRAHEVAHQWWGNLVDVQDWPQDRWLEESIAEYAAMEYYRIRFEKPTLVAEAIDRSWYLPETKGDPLIRKRLTGESEQIRTYQAAPISMGGPNVYTKGALVVHMLRYLFRAKQGNDGQFWELLRGILVKYRDQRISTAIFIAEAEKRLGEPIPWFWEQWLYGTAVPRIEWSHSVVEQQGSWLVTVQAKQVDTSFRLTIPVYFHFGGDRHASVPLWMNGPEARAEIRLPEKPRSVTLNDFYEALVVVR
ncbi:MAG: hypothetical protein MUF27_10775 [Acidobacteria bacterium]|jgi:hypothetical protein|nr:hypothetical protein [Acidobacteriota bacterium]